MFISAFITTLYAQNGIYANSMQALANMIDKPMPISKPKPDNTSILATGDIAPLRQNMNSMFEAVHPTLATGDINIGQLETVISTGGEASVHAKLAMRAPPSAMAAIKRAGFDVLSFAGNHCMDFGRAAFDDTLRYARAANMPICGAGQNLVEARTPVSIKKNGLKIAVLSYSSILPEGYAAARDRAGCAPLRAHTHYEQIEHDQPGTPARIHTMPHAVDMANMIDDIKAAKQHHDFVFLSVHWGIHFVPIEIADYQKIYAHAAINAGADAIFGHHPHILKGVEIYGRKPIFYSLGNFAIEQPQIFNPNIIHSESFAHLQSLNPNIDASAIFVCPPDSQYSMIAKLDISGDGLLSIGYHPIYIHKDSVPHPITAKDAIFEAHLNYVRHITKAVGFDTKFTAHGNHINIPL